jgi:hypothetical protein
VFEVNYLEFGDYAEFFSVFVVGYRTKFQSAAAFSQHASGYGLEVC